MRPSDDADATFFFRAYELPYGPVAYLAFRLSMMEGREGRGFASTAAELTAPWASPACSKELNRFLNAKKQ